MPSQIKNAAAVLGTSLTALVSCAAGQQIAITDINALNISGAGRTINLSLYQQATNTTYPIALPNRALANNSDPYRLPSKIFLTPGDELRASADAASGVVMSVMYAVSTSVPQLAKGFLGKGTWASGTTYDLNDVVDDGTNTYISLQKNNVGNTPSTATSYWMVNARRGPPGSNATGDVTGPTAAFDGELFVASGTTGKALKRTNIVPTTWGLARVADANQAATQTALGLKGAAYLDVNVANGVLTLDGNTKVPIANLPEAILGTMKYQSGWNANTNTPALPTPSAANKGWFYLVTTAGATPLSGPFGTINEWQIGDWAVSDGTYWEKVDSSDQVTRVAGLMGDITAAQLKTQLAYVFSDIQGSIGFGQLPTFTGDVVNSATGVMTIQAGVVTYAKMASAAFAAASDIWANVSSKILTAQALWAAHAPVNWGSISGTYAPDFNGMLKAYATVSGTLTLANPTNAKAGQGGSAYLTMGAANLTISYGTSWVSIGATPVAPTTSGAKALLSWEVQQSGEVLYTLQKIGA